MAAATRGRGVSSSPASVESLPGAVRGSGSASLTGFPPRDGSVIPSRGRGAAGCWGDGAPRGDEPETRLKGARGSPAGLCGGVARGGSPIRGPLNSLGFLQVYLIIKN